MRRVVHPLEPWPGKIDDWVWEGGTAGGAIGGGKQPASGVNPAADTQPAPALPDLAGTHAPSWGIAPCPREETSLDLQSALVNAVTRAAFST